MIEDQNDPIEPVPEEEVSLIEDDPRPKSPWKAFILTGLIASLIGAVGGGYGVYEGVKRFAPKAESQPVVDIAPMQTKLDSLTTRVSAAEASVRKAASRPAPVTEAADLSELKSRLDALENDPVDVSEITSEIEVRLGVLEAAPAPEIDPAALKALQSARDDGFEWPDSSDLEDRLAALQLRVETAPEPAKLPDNLMKRLRALEAGAKAAPAAPAISGDGAATMASQTKALEKKRIERIESRLTALEKRPTPEPRVQSVAILPFPKIAMIKAVEENEEGGMFKKMLSKHVRVKNDDDPVTLITQMEADVEQGLLTKALEKYDRLPDPVRDAGQAWHNSVKASL